MPEPLETKSQISSSGRLIRILVGGLPLGLVVMGALSFVLYFQKRNKPLAEPTEFAVMMRQDLNLEDFRRYLRVLHQEIGERTVRRQDNLNAVAAFMESTFEDMGYGIVRSDFRAEGKNFASLVAALPGISHPQEAILVLASHDSTEANTPAESAGTASLLCLARSMTGAPSPKTILFVSVSRPGSERQDYNGLWQAAQLPEVKSCNVSSIVVVGASEALPALYLPALWKEVPLLMRQVEVADPLAPLEKLSVEIKALASKP